MDCDARRGFDSRFPPSGRPDLVSLPILPTEARDRFASKLAIASIPGSARGVRSESGTHLPIHMIPFLGSARGVPSQSGNNIPMLQI